MSKCGAEKPTILLHVRRKAREIVMTCQVLQELGYGLTRSIVNDIVCHFLKDQKRENPFKDGIPGYDWWEGFLGRWPSLRERKPQHLSARRATAANPETLDSWFTMVDSFLREIGLLKWKGSVADFPCRIWNSDETGFCLGMTSKRILARHGDEVGGASDHQFITVNTCGSAAGVKLPLYKGKHLYGSWTGGGPSAACYGVSSSGWMEEINYYKWFEQQFYPPLVIFWRLAQ